MTSTNPVVAQINRTADDPSIAAYLPIPLAESLIGMAGGEAVDIDEHGFGRWVFPDGHWVWATEEALRYALEVLPDLYE